MKPVHARAAFPVLAFFALAMPILLAEEPKSGTPRSPKLVWKETCGQPGFSAPPAVHGDLAVVGTGWGGSALKALKLADGATAWTRALDDNGVGAVVRDGETTYSTTESCTIYSIPTKSGKIAWKRWLGDPVLSTPAIDGDRLYVGSGQARDGHLHLMCMNKKTGADLWSRRIPSEITGSPTVACGRVYVALNDGSVRAYDKGGKELWRAEAGAASVPTVDGASVYVNTRGGTVLACLDAENGRERWATEVADDVERTEQGATLFTMASTPIRNGSQLFVGNRAGELACLRVADGAQVWRRKLEDGPAPGTDRDARRAERQAAIAALSSPAFANQKIYVGSMAGSLHCVDARTGDELWRFAGDGPIRWSPVLHKGRVYFSTDRGTLFCVDAGDPKADGWDQWGGNAAHVMQNATSPAATGRSVVTTPEDEEEVSAEPASEESGVREDR